MENIPNKVFKARVVKSETVAVGVKVLSFKIDSEFIYEPWQYVWVEIPNMDIPDATGSRRAFSILNAKNTDHIIKIVARISNSGYKQNLFNLQEGDAVIIHGPFGNTFIVNEETQPANIVIIAGGVGIAAFLPMINYIEDQKYSIKCYLNYINKNEEATPFLNEIKSLKEKSNFFDYKVKYSHFSFDDVKDFVAKANGPIHWWVTGPKAMVNSVFSELERGGVSRSDMFFENFYPTVDGNLTKELIEAQLVDNIFAKAIQNATNHMVITDAEGVILFANKAAEKTTGYTNDEIIGSTPRLWGGMMSREFYVEFWRKKISGQPFSGQIVNRRKNGDIYYTIANIAPILDENRNVIGFVATEEDITESQIYQNNLERANKLMVDRELKMIELKREIADLKNKL